MKRALAMALMLLMGGAAQAQLMPNIPEDASKPYVTVFLEGQQHQLMRWFNGGHAGLAKLKATSHFNLYTPQSSMYQAKWKQKVRTFPCLMIQNKQGALLFKMSGKNLSNPDKVLGAIKSTIRYRVKTVTVNGKARRVGCWDCLNRNNPFNRSPDPYGYDQPDFGGGGEIPDQFNGWDDLGGDEEWLEGDGYYEEEDGGLALAVGLGLLLGAIAAAGVIASKNAAEVAEEKAKLGVTAVA